MNDVNPKKEQQNMNKAKINSEMETENKSHPVTSHKEAIVQFIATMDIEMLDAFLDENRTYQDLRKDRFLALLEKSFLKAKELGNSQFLVYTGKCGGCKENFGCSGFTFLGNETKHYMDLIVKSENDRVTDIFECSSFRNTDELSKKGKIWIDDIYG